MKRREKRDTAEGSTPFDDSLFQDLPLHYKLKLTEKKSRHRKKVFPDENSDFYKADNHQLLLI